MTLNELNQWFSQLLHPELYPMDPSLNGVQVQNSDPAKKEISKVAFAVDACVQTIERAADEGAGLLFTHHGILWGQCSRVCAGYYQRIAALLRSDMALAACHLPLDAHAEVGNNAGMAQKLGLRSVEPFGVWRGAVIGCMGLLEQEETAHTIARRLFGDSGGAPIVLPFGPDRVKRIAIVSGGAGDEVDQAIEAGADLFITGEIGHENYHTALEGGISVIGGGHYRTETFGVAALADLLRAETGTDTVFIDLPTGL